MPVGFHNRAAVADHWFQSCGWALGSASTASARASGCGPLAPPLQAGCGAVGASRLSLRLAGCGDPLPGNRTGMSAPHEHRHVDLASVDLYGEIEPLVRAAPDTGVSPGGGIATSSDALSAVAQLALTIERPAQTGDLDPELAYRMSSLLLVIRDYIAPVEPAEHERIIRYLKEITTALR
jgi:hypothetical protein